MDASRLASPFRQLRALWAKLVWRSLAWLCLQLFGRIDWQAPRRQPAPGRARLQQQRSVGALAQCRGQRDRLADIARAAVSDRPGRARSFHHWH